jgi:3-isopropylmalate/(R)-2-methylmalate dehydratase small subunit
MASFSALTGIAAPILDANIDTDVIMPKQFLKTITRTGLAIGAFHDLRFTSDDVPNTSFVLNNEPWCAAQILIVGPNFGCGSSREHAVWGLLQLGIKVIIGTSFAGIFYDNATRNGLLLVETSTSEVERLGSLARDPSSCQMTVNLFETTISSADGRKIEFSIEPLRREAILSGQDHIDRTLQYSDDIRAFEKRSAQQAPWLFENPTMTKHEGSHFEAS